MSATVATLIEYLALVYIGGSYVFLIPRSVVTLFRPEWQREDFFCYSHFKPLKIARENKSPILFLLLLVLAIWCLPFAAIHWLEIKRKHASQNDEAKVPIWKTDLWILFWGSINFFVTLPYVNTYPWLILFAVFRLGDLLYVFVERRALDYSPVQRGRALILLVFHYFEIATIFASWFGLLQHLNGQIFCISGCPTYLTPRLLLYYSGVTAVTLGYGDIVTCRDAVKTLSWFANPATYVLFQLLCGVVLTVLTLPTPAKNRSEFGRKDGNKPKQ